MTYQDSLRNHVIVLREGDERSGVALPVNLDPGVVLGEAVDPAVWLAVKMGDSE